MTRTLTRPATTTVRAALAARTSKVLAGALAVATAATLAACSSSSDASARPAASGPADLSKVTLELGDQKGLTQALLTASDALSGAPYKVSYATFTSGPPEIEAASAGKIDFAVTGNTPPVFGHAAKAKITVVTAYGNDGSSDAIVLPKGSGITSVADLKGKTVAVAKGSSADGHLLLQLTKAGLTQKDITIAYLQPADALAAFGAGKVDAWAVWDPYTAVAELQGGTVLVTAKGVANGYSFGVAADAALADAGKAAALQDLAGRLAKAYVWAASHPEDYAKVYAQQTSLPLAVAQKAERANPKPLLLDDTVTASEQALTDAFVTSGEIPAADPFASIVDDRFNAAVQPFVQG